LSHGTTEQIGEVTRLGREPGWEETQGGLSGRDGKDVEFEGQMPGIELTVGRPENRVISSRR